MIRGLRVLVAASLVAVALLLAACGSKKSASAPPAATRSTQTAATVKPPPRSVVKATRRRLARAALTTAALGAGWSAAPPRLAALVQHYCNQPILGDRHPFASAHVAFRMRFGSSATQDLFAYAGDIAKSVLDGYRTILAGCNTFTQTLEPGRTVDYTVSLLHVPKIADQTVAARVSASSDVGGIIVERSSIVVMARRGGVVDVVTQTANVGLFASKADALKLARAADHRLAAAS